MSSAKVLLCLMALIAIVIAQTASSMDTAEIIAVKNLFPEPSAFQDHIFRAGSLRKSVQSVASTSSIKSSNLESSNVRSTDLVFDESASNQYARYAAIAYCIDSASAKRVVSWDCYGCKKVPSLLNVTLIHMSNTSTNAYVGYSATENMVIVSMCGTDPLNIVNWITDLNFIKKAYPSSTDCPGCQVHGGFLTAAMSARHSVTEAVTALLREYPSALVTVTGHSLGAATAHLTTLFLLEDLPQMNLALPVYLFGGPRVGDDQFHQYTEKRLGRNGLFRVTHYKDPVVQLPSHKWGFTHPPTEVYYNDIGSKYSVCDEKDGEDKHCSYDELPWIIPNAIYHLNYGGYDFVSNYLKCKTNTN